MSIIGNLMKAGFSRRHATAVAAEVGTGGGGGGYGPYPESGMIQAPASTIFVNGYEGNWFCSLEGYETVVPQPWLVTWGDYGGGAFGMTEPGLYAIDVVTGLRFDPSEPVPVQIVVELSGTNLNRDLKAVVPVFPKGDATWPAGDAPLNGVSLPPFYWPGTTGIPTEPGNGPFLFLTYRLSVGSGQTAPVLVSGWEGEVDYSYVTVYRLDAPAPEPT